MRVEQTSPLHIVSNTDRDQGRGHRSASRNDHRYATRVVSTKRVRHHGYLFLVVDGNSPNLEVDATNLDIHDLSAAPTAFQEVLDALLELLVLLEHRLDAAGPVLGFGLWQSR